jgi:hypothetical protein
MRMAIYSDDGGIASVRMEAVMTVLDTNLSTGMKDA